ncbi:STM3941 family protein [Dysgonomonas reticulitermitis]
MDKIEIPISRRKSILILLGAIMFVVVGIWFAFYPPPNPFRLNPVFIQILGVVSVLFFGVCGVACAKTLITKRIGLTIDSSGILCNSGGAAVGFVPWEDIIDIEDYYISGQGIIKIIVDNPQKYIDRQKSAFSRRIAEMNYKLYDTPVQISANILKCDFAELYNLLKVELEENRVQIGRIDPHYLNNYVDETERRIEE